MILNRNFDDKSRGFYVDIGAHHPRRFSNTYFFYKRGWSGINVEPNPDLIRVFNSERKRDVNLQCGVGEIEGVLKYYFFNDPALNTFDESLVKWRLANTTYKIVAEADVSIVRLDNVLTKNLPQGSHIDFLSIDVEGLDFSVLKSNNWYLFRPSYVLAEVLASNLEEAISNPISIFMREQGYHLFGKTYNTFIFRDTQT
jgi:FkbM family methyltransferase